MLAITDNMLDHLLKLGLSEKESAVYLALLEFGTQPASIIAKRTKMPRPTVLFLFNELLKKGYIQKSHRGRTQYFYADPKDLKLAKQKQLEEEGKELSAVIPLLEEYKNPFTSPPKTHFYEGIEGCRRAYSALLESETEILEFATHEDLVKMGEEFMDSFIAERVRRKIFIQVLSVDLPLEKLYLKKDKKEYRKCVLHSQKNGRFYSSIDIYENKVLLLNLHTDPYAILLENTELAETFKTIHRLLF